MIPPLWPALLACGGSQLPWVTVEPSEAAAEAVAHARTALTADLLLTEFAAPLLDGAGGGSCPVRSTIVDGSVTTWTLDYGDGCLPESGLLDLELAGVVRLSADDERAELYLQGFRLAGRSFEGSGEGELSAATADRISLDFGIELDDPSLRIARAAEVELEPLRATLGGSAGVTTGGGDVLADLDAVTLYYDDVGQGCALPSAGQLSLSEGVDATVTFSASAAAAGLVGVETAAGAEELRFCEIETLLASG